MIIQLPKKCLGANCRCFTSSRLIDSTLNILHTVMANALILNQLLKKNSIWAMQLNLTNSTDMISNNRQIWFDARFSTAWHGRCSKPIILEYSSWTSMCLYCPLAGGVHSGPFWKFKWQIGDRLASRSLNSTERSLVWLPKNVYIFQPSTFISCHQNFYQLLILCMLGCIVGE